MNATACAVMAAGLACGGSAAQAQTGYIESEVENLVSAASDANGALDLARQQESAGDPEAAASTLERTLLRDANADDVRLAYAGLLCRLDDEQAARIELQAVRRRATGSPAWNDLVASCGSEIAAQAKGSPQLRGRMALGLSYDEDAFGALLGGFTFFPPNSRDGLALVGSAQLEGRTQGSNFFFGNARAYSRTDLFGPGFDFQLGELDLGFGHAAGNVELAIGPVLRHTRVEGDRMVTEAGGQFRASYLWDGHSRLSLEAEVVHEDFVGPFVDGEHYDLALTYARQQTGGASFFFGAAGEKKTASFAGSSYHAFRLMAGARLPIDSRGSYVNLSSTFRLVDFKDVEFVPRQTDKRFHNRLAVGTPIFGDRLIAEAAVSHSLRDYNKASFLEDYDSVGAEIRLIFNFSGGR